MRTRKSREALLSSAKSDHYTPEHVVEGARYVLGSIDLDPASCYEANLVVKAGVYYTAEQDGRAMPWFGNVFVNSPGEPTGRLSRDFYSRSLVHSKSGGTVFWLGYSLAQLQSYQKPGPGPSSFPKLIFADRLHFIDGKTLVIGDSPTHANYCTLMGGSAEQVSRFVEWASQYGEVTMPHRP